ncbi:MAG: hypothetical protein LBR17_07515 [Bacteroidales bacterium]|jgi:tetratricopeptide (TPR) repeat protein|nr:hypothetical protein [Bacteroidales bacterium]
MKKVVLVSSVIVMFASCSTNSNKETTIATDTLTIQDIVELESLECDQFLYNAEYDKAIECYEHIIQRDNENNHCLLYLGHAYSEKSNYDKALECYQKCLMDDLDSIDIPIYFSIANTYCLKKDLSKAEEWYQKIIDCQPNAKMENYYWIGNNWLYPIDNIDKADNEYYKLLKSKSIEYFKKAAQLGNKDAQKELKKQGIKWK